MNANVLRALEFDRIVEAVADLAVTPTGHEELLQLHPLTDPAAVAFAQKATTEGTRFLADHPGFPLRAPSDLEAIIDALGVEGRALEAGRLVSLADYLESIEHSRAAVRHATTMFPILRELVERIASFKGEIADVRKKIDPSGDVADNASPALASIRDRLRRQRAKLRTTLESFLRGRDTSKYLQEQVVTDRNGRYVLVVRAEHRSAIPGIVHGSSASGASLFLEPLTTVEVNNDIVALEEQEAEEVRRILLALTDQFRGRPDDLRRTIDVATALDVIQARARFSGKLGGVEPGLSTDGTFELRGARHPLLVPGAGIGDPEADPVPNDVLLIPPTRVMLITGPNTGGKTVALKTAGLLALMAQAGLHVPAEHGSRLPVFRCVFADIGDEQSISASLSTFSAHITNVVSMDQHLDLPALVLLDEVGAGTDPVEGGALGIAVIDHFRRRGAHLIGTTHYDALKSYASTTEGVTSAGFGFDPESFAPTYRLMYGSPGRSLAIEIAARLGMPRSVVAAARDNLTEEQKQLADHLARVDKDLRALEQERRQLSQQRAAVAESEKKLRGREESVREREETFRRRLDTKLDDQLRDARRRIDEVIDELKNRAPRLVNTGETGAARSEARAAIDSIVGRVGLDTGATSSTTRREAAEAAGPIEIGTRVVVGGLDLEGTVVELRGNQAEIDVRGKRMRAKLKDLRAIGGSPPPATVRVNVDLQPREGSLSELNVIGQTVDEAITRLEKFLDETTVTDQHTIRIVHGHGTGQLRRAIAAFLKDHPLVASYKLAPQNEGGGGATIVELKD
ncbi:MAG TPA: endonuclease MutS2 [Vicinamibacterales bacterium]|nr:endonuclease MutS2 [Vicinamibacterales bacterium]